MPTIDSTAGDDTITIVPGSGATIIIDPLGTDVIQLGDGIVVSDITLARTGSHLDIIISNGDSIRVSDYFYEISDTNGRWWPNMIEAIRFDDGSIVPLGVDIALNYAGTTGDDTLYGFQAADTISGGDGNDTLEGGAGNDLLSGGNDDDVYVFGAGHGADRIVDTAGADSIALAGDINAARVIVTRSGDLPSFFGPVLA